jgi:ribosomal 50S subunit-recycling heat shock protein
MICKNGHTHVNRKDAERCDNQDANISVGDLMDLQAENARLKAAIAKMVKERKEDTCAYCNQSKPELMLCCYECYREP